MKSKAIFVSFLAFLAIAFALSTVLASGNESNATTTIARITEVRINGVVASENTPAMSGEVTETVPVEVQFEALETVEKVRVEVKIDGYKDDIYEKTSYFHIVEGSKYVKRFNLKLPSTMDLDDLTERAELSVEVSAKGEDSVEKSYPIELQRILFSLEILSVDSPEKVSPGSTIALDVVVQNNGNDRLDNAYVKASIPELGIERKVYFGDLEPRHQESYDNIRNAHNKVVYLSIPRNAAPGTYNVVVEAYNYDTSTTTKKKLVIESSQGGVLPSVTARTIQVGEETTFDVVLVNPNDRMVIYSVVPEQTKGLMVEVSEPVATVPADGSKTVKVKVKAGSTAEEGTHLVTVNVNSETGLERKVDFTVNVEKPTSGGGTTIVPTGTNTVMVLTVVLVIIFVVLLIVLIVLLTKKPAESEEFGETSYY